MELDLDTLELALVAARLSSLAYRMPIQVEYLRLRANNNTQGEALQVIKSQVRLQIFLLLWGSQSQRSWGLQII